MLAEAEACPSEAARLRWAWGCWVASLRTRTSVNTLLYTALLAAGLALLAAYEWHADESRRTVIVLSLISLALGALHPRHAIVSGALTGLVVAAIIGFEAITGIRPAYEVRAQTLQHSLFWLILLVPALSSAAVGGKIGRVLRPARQSP